ncbi:TonB-dependent receptor [Pontibacter rugosus]
MQISAIGYATVTRRINLERENIEIDIQLVGANKQLGEVTVTAQKWEEDPQQIPISISVLSTKEVQDYRLWNSREITAIVPNLYTADPGDNRNVTSIRGITTTSYDPAVATYIDGVNQFGLDTYMAELLDIERIEVLRGPQGTLYGRNAMGGVIHIITKEPTNDIGGSAEVSIGNYGQWRYSAALRAPLVKDRLFFGVAGLYRRQDGYYKNQFDDSDFDKQKVYMGNYYMKFLAGPKLDFTLNLKHITNRNRGAFPLVFSPEEAFVNSFKVNQNAIGEMIDNTLNASLSVRYSTSTFMFTSQTAYQSNYRYYDDPLDGDFSPIDGVSIVNNYGNEWNRVQVQTQEFRLTSPGTTTSALQWIAGAYGFYNYSPVKQGVHFGEDAELVGAPFPNFTSISTNKGESYGAALYGQGTYVLNPKFEITAGIRYDYENKKQGIKGEFQMDGEDAFITRTDTAAEDSFTAFSPKAGLTFHITENNHLYGTYSRGYRAGGITQLSSDPSQPPLYAYKPETSNNFEIGIKNTFRQNKWRINFAAFYTKVADAQVPTLVLPEAIVITRNAGKLDSKGVELEISSALAKGLELTYNGGYTDAVYTTLKGVSDGEEVSLNGNRQLFTPEVTSMLALQYGFELGGSHNWQLVARGEWHYLGEQYFDLTNQIKQEAYGLLHARAGISSRKLDVFFWGRNLGDKKYIAYAYNFGATRLGDPANYGFSVKYRL